MWRSSGRPGSAHVDTDRQAVREAIFERPLEALYNTGGMDQFRLCEWGVMKRAVDGERCGQRPAKIVGLGAAMSKFAIVASPHSGIFEPEQLKDRPVAVTIYNGSHFTTLKMLEGFLRREDIKVTNAGTMHQRLEAVRRGELAAATFNEPWISVAQKQGFRIIMESHSTRSEAAGDEMDGPTLAALFRAEAEAAHMINANPGRYAHYLTEEARGLLEPTSCRPGACCTRHRLHTPESASGALTSGCWGIPSWSLQVQRMRRSSTTVRGSRPVHLERSSACRTSAPSRRCPSEGRRGAT